MTNVVEVEGGRVIRVENPEALLAWGMELAKAIRRLIEMSHESFYTAEDIALALKASVTDPHRIVLLTFDDRWRLIGFAMAGVFDGLASGRREMQVALYYNRPRKAPKAIAPALNKMLDDWGRDQGAIRAVMWTKLDRDDVWERYGYAPFCKTYTKEL
jgi:hypothetical protein